MEKVTVMVLSYHSGDTIIETLESVKAQTYEKIELIVADDASKDDSAEVCKAWIEKNKERFTDAFVVKHPENHGIPGNINGALDKVTGKYCEILAADDLLYPEAMAEYVSFMEATDHVMPVGNVVLFCDDDRDLTNTIAYGERCKEYLKLDQEEQYRKLLVQNWIVSPPASFYPTQFLRDVGGFVEEFRWMEDYPMNLLVLRNGYRFGHMDKDVMKYRISGNSVTGGHATALKKTEMKFFFRRRMWYLIQNGQGMEALKQIPYWLKVLKAK